jgi:hypothetical protein
LTYPHPPGDPRINLCAQVLTILQATLRSTPSFHLPPTGESPWHHPNGESHTTGSCFRFIAHGSWNGAEVHNLQAMVCRLSMRFLILREKVPSEVRRIPSSASEPVHIDIDKPYVQKVTRELDLLHIRQTVGLRHAMTMRQIVVAGRFLTLSSWISFALGDDDFSSVG